MFTGIVQGIGRLVEREDLVLLIDPPETLGIDYQIGESIAVNGCCLTATATSPLRFDLSPETLHRTTLGGLKLGDKINLERAMTAASRFGGHIVQGHVDALGRLESSRVESNSVVLHFSGPVDYDRYLIDKGSVTVDGISLTVVSPSAGEFDVWVIPHTLENTSLGELSVGDAVNLEYDVIAKHLEKLALPYVPSR